MATVDAANPAPTDTDRKPERLALGILLTMLVALGPISTDLYLPSLPRIGRDLGASEPSVQLTLSVFLVVFAAAQLIYGPLSDRFGRKPVLIGGLCIYLVATAACAFAPTIDWLIAGRAVQAFGACVGPVIGRAVVRDVYGRERAARVLAYMGAAMAVAPAVGPVIGGIVTAAVGWQANFGLLAVFGIMALVGIRLILTETNFYLNAEATRIGPLLRNYRTIARNREFAGHALTMTFAFSGLFTFISGSSFVFIEYFELSEMAYGFCFASAVAGYVTGSLITGRITMRVGVDRLVAVGVTFTTVFGVTMAVIGLTGIFTIATILVPMFGYMIGMGLLLPNAMSRAIGPFPQMAGAASALMGFTSFGVASVWGAVCANLSTGTPLVMTVAIGLGGTLAMVVYLTLARGAANT